MDLIKELRIIGDKRNIFASDIQYVIPLYQRGYAWTEKQIEQLIEDVRDINPAGNYYIGSLIVSAIDRSDNVLEVVDGQQRLTTLYMLLSFLGCKVGSNVTFECRDKSNYTLKHIRDVISGDESVLDADRLDQGLLQGIESIRSVLRRSDFDATQFIQKLEHVVLYQILVPEHTDLNRYFEVMNTRGEQLEQHDILKASLMSCLTNDEDKSAFAKIWNACSDMTGYVQMHFVSKNNTYRNKLFGNTWEELPRGDWDYYSACLRDINSRDTTYKLRDIVSASCAVSGSFEEGNNDEGRIRFESIIDFPYFLLHTLRVFNALYGIRSKASDEKFLSGSLDDKRLIESFNAVIENGEGQFDKTGAYGAVMDNRNTFVQLFALCLLRTRYLFDAYIIKREYAYDDVDGRWSLKSLHMSLSGGKKPYYSNTRIAGKGRRTTTNDEMVKDCIMIQSALRVSYTSPKAMHWITELLLWLSEKDAHHITHRIEKYSEYTENIAKRAVRDNFFLHTSNGTFAMGVDTPHIVLNYLDYLLWKDWKQNPYTYAPCDFDDFTFEFRNSIEHWYPQNPSVDTFEKWADVDTFGNLCLVSRSVNSRFSNMAPEAKKATFTRMISKGSLKLRVMSYLTDGNDGQSASDVWKSERCAEHQEKMIKLLKDACSSFAFDEVEE